MDNDGLQIYFFDQSEVSQEPLSRVSEHSHQSKIENVNIPHARDGDDDGDCEEGNNSTSSGTPLYRDSLMRINWTTERELLLLELCVKYKVHLRDDIKKNDKWLRLYDELFANKLFKGFHGTPKQCGGSKLEALWKECDQKYNLRGKRPEKTNKVMFAVHKMIQESKAQKIVHEDRRASRNDDAALIRTRSSVDMKLSALPSPKSCGRPKSVKSSDIKKSHKKKVPAAVECFNLADSPPTIKPSNLKTKRPVDSLKPSDLSSPSTHLPNGDDRATCSKGKENVDLSLPDSKKGRHENETSITNFYDSDVKTNPFRIDMLQKNISFFENRLKTGSFKDMQDRQNIQNKLDRWTVELLSL